MLPYKVDRIHLFPNPYADDKSIASQLKPVDKPSLFGAQVTRYHRDWHGDLLGISQYLKVKSHAPRLQPNIELLPKAKDDLRSIIASLKTCDNPDKKDYLINKINEILSCWSIDARKELFNLLTDAGITKQYNLELNPHPIPYIILKPVHALDTQKLATKPFLNEKDKSIVSRNPYSSEKSRQENKDRVYFKPVLSSVTSTTRTKEGLVTREKRWFYAKLPREYPDPNNFFQAAQDITYAGITLRDAQHSNDTQSAKDAGRVIHDIIASWPVEQRHLLIALLHKFGFNNPDLPAPRPPAITEAADLEPSIEIKFR